MTSTIKQRASEQFAHLSWPSTEEEWRRTPLERLLPKGSLDKTSKALPAPSQSFSLPKPVVTELPQGMAVRILLQGQKVVSLEYDSSFNQKGFSLQWVDGASSHAMDFAANELDEQNRFTAWHWRDTPGFLEISVTKNTVIPGLVVVEQTLPTPSTHHPRVHLCAESSSQVQVVWILQSEAVRREDYSIIDGDSPSFVLAGFGVKAHSNAQCELLLIQNLSKQTAFFSTGTLESQADAHIQFHETHLGASLTKTSTHALLQNQGADIRLGALALVQDGGHTDIGVIQNHASPHCSSDALAHVAVKSGGRSVFQGRIDVAPHASKTDAYLTNKNLILGDGARADSIPRLDILTDDVRCSHGSTTGKLDEEQLFYLTSRGYSVQEARDELLQGFLRHSAEKLSSESVALLEQYLDAALAKDKGGS